MTSLVDQIKPLLRNPCRFVDSLSHIELREYQREVVRAIVESVVRGQGRSIVVMFPRQSGKNEVQAQIEAYLLTLLSLTEAEVVKVSPTWKPQSLNAMRRLERVLSSNVLTRSIWRKERGYIYRVGSARVFFLSGAPEANIVGATASTLLEVDEAQDVETAKFDKDIAPMAASTNATRVFWGTAWTGRTLLARELRAACEAEKRDGLRRVFRLTAEDVAREVPAYGLFVAEQVARLGRNHPMVRTQFYSEEIDSEGGLFGPGRVALMKGDHQAQYGPGSRVYALLLDVAGEDEGQVEGEASADRRDSTALTVVECDLSTLADPVLKAPTYRVMMRRAWVGVKHSTLYGEIRAMAMLWHCKYLVVDATGVGAGLASFLERALPGKVVQHLFTQSSKSALGWGWLGIIDSGRWKEPSQGDALAGEFWRQLSFIQYEILPGPQKFMRWSVPDGTKDPQTGEKIHDDLVLSAALASVLDGLEWSAGGPAVVARRVDPLKELDRGF